MTISLVPRPQDNRSCGGCGCVMMFTECVWVCLNCGRTERMDEPQKAGKVQGDK